jgi:hypothetical protein
MVKNPSFLAELWGFMKHNKKWWLAPLFILLAIIGTLIWLGQSSPVAPFIYALF